MLPERAPRAGTKLRGILKRVWVVAPPAGEARQGGVVGEAFVHEDAGDAAGAGVEVFVGTEAGVVDVPVVQRERDVPGGVREVEAAGGPDRVGRGRDAGEVEELSGVIIHGSEHNRRQGIFVFPDGGEDVVVPQRVLAFPGFEVDHRLGGIEAVVGACVSTA